jgi:hypothetical protein
MAIVFGKTLKRKPIIKLGTTTLPVKEDARYLGVYFGSETQLLQTHQCILG